MRYFLKAFTYHWNLLFAGTAAALGLMFAAPDVVLPLLGAVEILYVSILGTRPAFRQAVDAAALPQPGKDKSVGKKSLEPKQMLAALTQEERNAFEHLRELCLRLEGIARQIKGQPDFNPEGLTRLKKGGINRLLWLYLRLLYSKNALERFFKTIDKKDIEAHIGKVRRRLQDMGGQTAGRDTPLTSRRRKSINDTLNTLEQRLETYRGAREQYDFIEVELERLHSKITGLAEMGINRQDPSMTSHIDVIANSVRRAEEAMNQLQSFTGASFKNHEPPQLLKE